MAPEAPGQPRRRHLLRLGLALVGSTAVYNVLEGVISVVAGIHAGSVALVGFGLDSGIETLASVVVFLRLYEEYRGHDADAHFMSERRAEWIVGVTLLALSAYVLYEGVRKLAVHEAPAESVVGLVVAALSAVLMPVLGLAKRRTARRLGSRSLYADGTETLVCSWLSWTLLAGLALNAWRGWWWADPAAALVMLPLIVREGVEAVRGEDEDD